MDEKLGSTTTEISLKIGDDREKMKAEKQDVKDMNTENDKKIHFYCENCGMEEWCHYFGKEPPFVNKIKFLEDCYTMCDVFSPPTSLKGLHPKAEYFFVLGAHCVECKKIVCKGLECSFFYGRTYCINCAQQNIDKFPVEIRTKIKKQIMK